MTFRKLFAALLLMAGAVTVQAQDMPLPQDKNVRVGKLDNGLTYYIRHNEYPEKVANYYIAQKVGSVQEEESQRGLAHLLEHMAFNGTDHFQDNLLQEYLQSIGVEYGRNLNAYTSTDQTVYFFTDVPATRQTAIDSCMLILKDWSNGISLTEKAIDAERDIVHNEYRMRITGTQKILEGVLPQMYPGSKYGERFPIGLMSVIDGCSPETLRAYYRKWYRPDNQAIIVVGDIDVDYIEGKIKELFSPITVPADAAKVEIVEVPDNNEGVFIVGKDKEQQVSMFLASMKHEAFPDSMKQGMQYLIFDYMRDVMGQMMTARFSEEAQKPECPFLQADASDGQYLVSRSMDALTLTVVPKADQDLQALAAGVRELKRAKDFGFTATEYDRARSEYLSRLEKAYNNREKTPSNDYCQTYVNNFINAEPIVAIDDEYQLMNQIAPMIPVDAINQLTQQLVSETDTNLVVLACVQEKDGKEYFTSDQMQQTIQGVRQETLEAYVDNVKQEPLMAQAPQAGTIVAEEKNDLLGFTKLTLSNGAKVVMKKTDFNADEILLSGRAEGGDAVLANPASGDAQLASLIFGQSGLGTFSNNDLQKALAGKQCSADLTINGDSHGIVGSTTPKDLETMMQLVYLKFTNISKDEKAVNSILDMIKLNLKNMSLNNDMVFQDSLMSTVYGNNPKYRVPTVEMVDAISYDQVMAIWKQLYSDASGFTFTFVGNYDEPTLRNLVCQYIASLPVAQAQPAKKAKKSKKNKKAVEPAVKDLRTFVNGEVKNAFKKKMENPQAQATEVWRSDVIPYTLENDVLTDVSSRMLDMTFNREIRERMSAAYHAGAEGEIDYEAGKAYAVISGVGKLNPDKAAEAIPEFQKGMNATIAAPSAEDLNKVKQILLKQADVDAKTNTYWRSVLGLYNRLGIDFYTNYKQTVEGVTLDKVSQFLRDTVLKSGNHAEVTMMPE
ncbi:MAG: insulinase family protein [Prevotella sp.]|nr:insulinase family protein [Prevotella sp.]